MKSTRVKKLVIELSGKDVELSIEQAKELQAALNELFEEKVKVVEKERLVPQPYPVPSPYPVYPPPYRPWHPWGREPWITWSGESSSYKTVTGTQFSLSGNSLRCQLKS